jgi:EmrB/QacA subfamily drug resistance transporter
MSDRWGRKPVFIASLGAFTGASILCATAPTLGALVLFRVLQGLGGGALMPTGMATAFELFPRERHGRAIAVWGMSAMVAPAVGPTLGGWLVTSVSWRYMFIINAPIGIAAVIGGFKLLPSNTFRQRRPFDRLGFILGSGGLSLTVLGLSQANEWGWTSPATVGTLVLGVASLGFFVLHELDVKYPMLQLRIFSERTFRLSMGIVLFTGMANFARLVFVPLQLESLRGDSALKVGLLFFPPAVITAGAMAIAGRLCDRAGPRLPLILGAATTLASLIGFSQLHLHTPLYVICVLLSVQGIGFGLVGPPALVAGLSDLPKELMAQGTALRSLFNQVAGALAVAAFGAVVAAMMGTNPSSVQAQHAYNGAFVAASIGVLLSLVLAFRLPKEHTAPVGEFDEALALAAE